MPLHGSAPCVLSYIKERRRSDHHQPRLPSASVYLPQSSARIEHRRNDKPANGWADPMALERKHQSNQRKRRDPEARCTEQQHNTRLGLRSGSGFLNPNTVADL